MDNGTATVVVDGTAVDGTLVTGVDIEGTTEAFGSEGGICVVMLIGIDGIVDEGLRA